MVAESPRGRTALCSYRGGVVAADHAMASEAGATILRAGGNAVDAAVATSLALAVVRPYSCGLGGGGYMLIHLRRGTGAGPSGSTDGRTVTLDYRECAPECMGSSYFVNIGVPLASKYGPHAVGIPGTIAGLGEALERWGTMTLSEVVEPARQIAEGGHSIDAHYVRSVASIVATLKNEEGLQERLRDWNCGFEWVWKNLLFDGDPKVGQCLSQPELAQSLREIAGSGTAKFQRDRLGPALAAQCRHIRPEESGGYSVTTCPPVEGDFRGWRVMGMGSSCSGGRVVLETLGILSRLSQHLDRARRGSVEWVHLLSEAFKHAFADRARNLGDPRFVGPAPLWMLDPVHLDDLASRFDAGRTLPPEMYGQRDGASGPAARGAGTSHFSVVDRAGNAVACTETINLEFGSLSAIPDLGILLNNEMDDFSTNPAGPNHFGLVESELNAPHPGKRPLSCMAPTIVLDESGQVELTAGGSGGPRIMTATLQVMLDVLLKGETVAAAVAKPRFHQQWTPNAIWFEHGRRDAALEAALAGKGHEIRERDIVGCVQVIARDRSGECQWQAACDFRKGGGPAAEDP